MLKSVHAAFERIQDILVERNEMHRMSNISTDTLKMTIDFLTPFKQATEALSGSNYPTPSHTMKQ